MQRLPCYRVLPPVANREGKIDIEGDCVVSKKITPIFPPLPLLLTPFYFGSLGGRHYDSHELGKTEFVSRT